MAELGGWDWSSPTRVYRDPFTVNRSSEQWRGVSPGTMAPEHNLTKEAFLAQQEEKKQAEVIEKLDFIIAELKRLEGRIDELSRLWYGLQGPA